MADRRRPWHGASDRAAEPAVAALRLHRVEVEALLALRHAQEGEAGCLAWWRLQRARAARIALLDPAAAAKLPPLPAPPPGALTWWQGVLHRLGRLDLHRASPPAPVRRRLGS
jgi:hypothetical protein